MERKNAWNTYDETQLAELEALNKNYRDFLNKGKTERECVTETIRQAEAAGYREFHSVLAENGSIKAGDKIYAVCMKKSIVLFQIGTEPLEKGMAILGAHID